MVVLVDGRTASAAEILAAALADRGRAVVVGSATLGKGLVQTIAPLPDGGELFVTWSRVLAPLGWPIQGLGVLPQVCTSLGPAHGGTSARSAGRRNPADGVGALARTHRPRPGAARRGSWQSATPAPPPSVSELDLEVAHFLIDNPAAYAAALLPPLREALRGPMVGPP